MEMHVKYVSDDLIDEVREDIDVFGKDFGVYAVYCGIPSLIRSSLPITSTRKSQLEMRFALTKNIIN